jgi:hypothetical protein
MHSPHRRLTFARGEFCQRLERRPAVTGTIPATEVADVARETVVQAILDRPLRVGAQGAALTLAGPVGPVVAALRWVAADELPSFGGRMG